MGAVKFFQGGNHINKKVPASFAQSPLPLESFLHIQTWHTKYPTSGYHYALEFNVSFAGMAGIAFNISTLFQHRWNASANWSPSIAQADLLQMCDKHGVTLRAMGLDHTRVPVTRNPDYPTTESMHIQLHGSDFAQLPLSGVREVVDRVPASMVMVLVMVSRSSSRAFQGSINGLGILLRSYGRLQNFLGNSRV